MSLIIDIIFKGPTVIVIIIVIIIMVMAAKNDTVSFDNRGEDGVIITSYDRGCSAAASTT